MRILLTGARGFVGSGLIKAWPEMIPAPSLRGADEARIARIVGETEPDVIIHTAAISDTRECERDPEASREANVMIPVYLAKACAGRKLICFSSDQVYTGCAGEGPYTEEDANPANVYGKHKLEMEKRVLDLRPDAVMLRAEWMYEYPVTSHNYLEATLGRDRTPAFSSGEYRGVTWLREVAENMPAVYRMPGGVYNFGSETDLSAYQLTVEFLRYLGRDAKVADCAPGHNLWIRNDRARAQGVRFSTALDALKKCADAYHLRETPQERNP